MNPIHINIAVTVTAPGLETALLHIGTALLTCLRQPEPVEIRSSPGDADRMREAMRAFAEAEGDGPCSVAPAAPVSSMADILGKIGHLLPPDTGTVGAAECPPKRRRRAGENRGACVVWTPERDAYLDQHYPDGTGGLVGCGGDWTDGIAALNALPGVPITTGSAILKRADKLGLLRSPEFRAEGVRRAAQAARDRRAADLAALMGAQPAPTDCAPPVMSLVERQLAGVPIEPEAELEPPPPAANGAWTEHALAASTPALARPHELPRLVPRIVPSDLAAAVEPPEPPARLSPVMATFAEIAAWARENGMRYDGTNIGFINKSRRERGAGNFILQARQA